MAKDDAQERTQQPTPKRLKDAREKGQVARSRELNTALLLLTSASCFIVFGGRILNTLQNIMEKNFSISRGVLYDDRFLLSYVTHALQQIGMTMLPFFLALMIIVLLSPTLLGGWLLSGKACSAQWERISPLAGLKRMFSLNSLMEIVKSLLKFTLILGCSMILFIKIYPIVLSLGHGDANSNILEGLSILTKHFFLVSASLIVIALIDVPYQLWSHQHKLRMSHQEIKEELKQTEVRSEVKQRIRKIQYLMSQKRMMEELPSANVVLMNPTHYAVALRYNQKKDRAPCVVAKGADLIACRIRDVAKSHRIEIVTYPALTRAIYFNTELFQEIPSGLYTAVAQVLAYIYQLKRYHAGHAKKPQLDTTRPIPNEFVKEDT